MRYSGPWINFARIYSVASRRRRGVDRIISFFGEKYHFLCVDILPLDCRLWLLWLGTINLNATADERKWKLKRNLIVQQNVQRDNIKKLSLSGCACVRASKTVTECRRLCTRMTNKTTKQECQTFNILFRLLFFIIILMQTLANDAISSDTHTHIEWMWERSDQRKGRIALIPLKCHAHTSTQAHTRAHTSNRAIRAWIKCCLHMYENMRTR